jgi:hypothetical protein
MGADGFSDAFDAAMVVHGRHVLMEQVVTVGGEDVESFSAELPLVRAPK